MKRLILSSIAAALSAAVLTGCAASHDNCTVSDSDSRKDEAAAAKTSAPPPASDARKDEASPSAAMASTQDAQKQSNVIELAPEKIALLIADVGPLGSVTETENSINRVMARYTDSVPPLISPGARSIDTLRLSQVMTWEDYWYEITRYKTQSKEIVMRNRRMEEIYTQLRKAMTGNRSNRDSSAARDTLQSFLQPYSDSIEIVNCFDTDFARIEKALGGNDSVDVASSMFFLTVVMQDMSEESNTVQVGNTMVKKTVCTRKAVAKVRDCSGNVIYAFNVKAGRNFRQTSVTKNRGHDPSSDIMEDLMKQIADQVAAEFTSTLTVKVSGPRGDQEFNPDAVVLYLDGKEFDNGGRVITGKHALLAECDGYRPIVRLITVKSSDRCVPVFFKKETPAPAPAGAAR